MRVPCRVQIDGERHEPFELVDIELPEEATGSAIDLLNQRKGVLLDMSSANQAGMVTVQYEVPSRGMNGVKTRLLSATKARPVAVHVCSSETYAYAYAYAYVYVHVHVAYVRVACACGGPHMTCASLTDY